MSKAVFSLQRSVRFQRAVLFAMINPQVGLLKYFDKLRIFLVQSFFSQPNGAGFAGVKSNISFSEEDLKVR